MFYIKLGLRNIGKNIRRSMMTLLSIVIGMTAVILAGGYIKYMVWGLGESTINSGTGHFQIYQKGYSEFGEDKPFDYMITNYKAVYRKISEIPGVKSIAPRVSFQGIISTEEKSTIAMGNAGWPDEEKALNSFSEMAFGDFYTETNYSGVIIGAGMAKKLKVTTNDTLTLMSTMKGGGFNAADVEIVGIMTVMIAEYNNMMVLGNLEYFQDILFVGDAVHKLVIVLHNTDDWKKIEPQIKKAVDEMGLEYKTWIQLATYYVSVKGMFTSMFNVLMMIILTIVIFAIANTMFMNLYERIREIGTIRALGTSRMKVAKIFLAESMLIGIIGSILGIILGFIIAGTINALGGFYVPPPPGNSEGYYSMIKVDFVQALGYMLIFVMISMGAAILPANKAAKISIADALRWI